MKALICDPVGRDGLNYLKKNKITVVYRPEITRGELLKNAAAYDALLVRSRTKVTADIINESAKLKIIGRIGSGYDNIDIDHCLKRNITVINSPDANSQSVAELTVGLMIALSRRLEYAFSSMRKGNWLKNEIWGNEISGRTVGLVGYGYVGTKVAAILSAFGCKLLIYSLNHSNCTLPELFAKSDIVSLHVALTPKTEGMIDKKLLSLMKKNAYLVNISRGKTVNEEALYNALKNKNIAGAVLDVFWTEPLPANSRWRRLPNVILTPHIGAATVDALNHAGLTVAQDLVRISKGLKPRFQVI